jgi:hypothetical protein
LGEYQADANDNIDLLIAIAGPGMLIEIIAKIVIEVRAFNKPQSIERNPDLYIDIELVNMIIYKQEIYCYIP